MNNCTSCTSTSLSQVLLPRSEGVAFCAVSLLESLIIVIGNSLTVALFVKHKALLRKPRFYLLVNLAVADFLTGAVVVPMWAFSLARHFDLWDHERSRLRRAVELSVGQLITHSSLVNLMIISLERMYATFRPNRHRALGTTPYRVMIGLSWFLPLVVSCSTWTHLYELMSSRTYYFLWTSFLFCVHLIICVAYTSIWIKIKTGGRPHKHAAANALNRKFTLFILIVIAVSMMTWLPNSVIHAVCYYGLSSRSLPYSPTFIRIKSSTVILLFANSLVNPIIYTLRIAQIRKAVTICFYKCSRKNTLQIRQGHKNEQTPPPLC